jgi:hypothetical protein
VHDEFDAGSETRRQRRKVAAEDSLHLAAHADYNAVVRYREDCALDSGLRTFGVLVLCFELAKYFAERRLFSGGCRLLQGMGRFKGIHGNDSRIAFIVT